MSVFTQAEVKPQKEEKTKPTQQNWNDLLAHAHDNHPRSQATLAGNKVSLDSSMKLEFEQLTCVIHPIGDPQHVSFSLSNVNLL